MAQEQSELKRFAASLAGLVVVAGAAFVPGLTPHLTAEAAAVAASAGETTAMHGLASTLSSIPPVRTAEVALPVSHRSGETVRISTAERARLAKEMSRWKTRDARQLVEVVANHAEKEPLPLPPTFLLSIAWSETRGKILAVSPAGAAGLAQATPSAYLSEGLGGKVFITTDYLTGTRAFIMKKPLGDALTIVAPLLKQNTPATRERAKALVAEAIKLRQEGMNELEALRPVANETFFRKIGENDAYNLTMLTELELLIDRGAPAAETKRFQSRIQKDYTYLRNLQRNGWAKYAKELSAERDALLRQRFGQSASSVITNRPYEAGEYLGQALDARFSPTEMVAFLSAHLSTKQQEARELGFGEEHIQAWTAALYNGGAVNVKRMQAGLIGALRETEKYMKAVPAKAALLERAMG